VFVLWGAGAHIDLELVGGVGGEVLLDEWRTGIANQQEVTP
jgi:hypothetical protein